MVTEEKCWRCESLGVQGEECKGCGATIGSAAPVGSRKTSDPKEQELDRIAAKYRSEKRGTRSSASGESDEIALLTAIANNTASTAHAVASLSAAGLYLLVTAFLSGLFYNLAMIPVQACTYGSCQPAWFLVIVAGVIALLGIIGACASLLRAGTLPSSRR